MGNIIKVTRVPITEGLVGDDKEEAERQVGELRNQLDELYSIVSSILAAGGAVAAADGDFVLHGGTADPNLPEALLHRDLVGADLHIPKIHATSHLNSGSDPLQNWVDDETPAGVIDGANAAFTLLATPGPLTGLLLVLNGVIQFKRAAAGPTFGFYDIVGNAITYEVAPPAGSTHRAWYRI